MQSLIEGGADVNAPDDSGLTPLALAAMQGQTAIARLLIAAKADVNDASSDGTTPLMRAASANHGETVRLLIASGADVNARNAGGMTRADGGGLRRLRRAGARAAREPRPTPNAKDNQARTALMAAVTNGEAAVGRGAGRRRAPTSTPPTPAAAS